jgi:hypothetical protein
MGMEHGNRHAPLIQVVVPGWNHRLIIELPFRPLPKEIRDAVYQHFSETPLEGFRCYAEVNLDAEIWEELIFSKWELTDEN